MMKSGERVSVSTSSGREPGTMRWRWSWLSAVWLIFFANVKFACCSARMIGACTPMFSVSRR